MIKIISSEKNLNIVEDKPIGNGATSEEIEAFHQEKLSKRILDVFVTPNDEIDKIGETSSDDEYDDGCCKVSLEQLKR